MEERIPGWMSKSELYWISDLVEGRGDTLEIGTFCGLTTQTLLKCVKGTVFSVDPLSRKPPNDPDAHRWIGKLAIEYPKKLIFFPALSTELIWRRPIDVLFIDGDHSFEAVTDDLERFVPFLLEDGLLILDDFNTEDVSSALNHYCNRYRKCQADLTKVSQHGKLAAFRNGRQTKYP
jgi:predicted O-methyltransferase YrrM